jgi:hypothetical protein
MSHVYKQNSGVRYLAQAPRRRGQKNHMFKIG